MLYLVGTPIGNLDDMTFRAIKVLQQVDLIAAEDTRHTANLLRHFEIETPLTSYHEHNKAAKGTALLEKLQRGMAIALVTDAGMPAISDPGADLVRLCIENGVEVTVVPGPTAFATALVLSGLSTNSFVFEGFLPVKASEKQLRLQHLCQLKQTVVFYEAPHKLLKTLAELQAVFGSRQIAVCRELTKKYEEVFRGDIEEAIAQFTQRPPKGEFVLVVEGKAEEAEVPQTVSVIEQVQQKMEAGMDKKTAIAHVAKIRGISKREVYNQTLQL